MNQPNQRPFGAPQSGQRPPENFGPPPSAHPQGYGPPPGAHPQGWGPPPGYAPQAAYGYPPPHDPTKSEKNWIATLLLAIFVGGFGVHSFYAGRVGLGIARVGISVLTIGSYIAFIVAMVSAAPKGRASVYYGQGQQVAASAESGSFGFAFGFIAVFGIVVLANMIWTIVDIILIAMGKFRDGRGKLIKP